MKKKVCRKVNFETRYSKACIVKLLKVRRNYSYALSSLQTVVILLLLENAVIGRWNIFLYAFQIKYLKNRLISSLFSC